MKTYKIHLKTGKDIIGVFDFDLLETLKELPVFPQTLYLTKPENPKNMLIQFESIEYIEEIEE